MSELSTEHLRSLLEQRLQALEGLLQIALHQSTCLDNENAEQLLSIVARKQPLIDQLLQVQADIQPHLAIDSELRTWSDPNDRAYCQRLATTGNEAHQSLIQIESQLLEHMQANRDAIAAQLQNGRDASLAASAYADAQVNQSSVLDFTS